jgi:hypothetical protein
MVIATLGFCRRAWPFLSAASAAGARFSTSPPEKRASYALDDPRVGDAGDGWGARQDDTDSKQRMT